MTICSKETGDGNGAVDVSHSCVFCWNWNSVKTQFVMEIWVIASRPQMVDHKVVNPAVGVFHFVLPFARASHGIDMSVCLYLLLCPPGLNERRRHVQLKKKHAVAHLFYPQMKATLWSRPGGLYYRECNSQICTLGQQKRISLGLTLSSSPWPTSSRARFP